MVQLITSLACCTVVTLTFVGSLYIWPYRDRNDPRSIRLRSLSVAITCALSTLLVCYILPIETPGDFMDTIGISPSRNLQFKISALPPLILTALLFLGPLAVLKDTYILSELKQELLNEICLLSFWRNYLIAPLAEEFVFRGVMTSLLSASINSPFLVVIISSIFFSLAHSHHYFLQNVQNTRLSFSEAISMMAMTMIFGCYGATFFLKSHCLISSIICHIFCNFMGFPDFETLMLRKKWWYPTIIGTGIWFVAFPCYLMYF